MGFGLSRAQFNDCRAQILRPFNSVVHPKLFFPDPDPDPTLTLISDPDPDSDPDSNPDPAYL
jgi:hypothetical protein